jgi:hypothetical protein
VAISESHASHIRKVRVSFWFEAPDLDPGEVTKALGLNPTHAGRRGDVRRNAAGNVLGSHEQGWWSFSSEGAVDSKDINEHVAYLQARLQVSRETLAQIAPDARTYFDVVWKSTSLYSGTGPLMDADSIAGVAALGAGIGFDIYQVDENEDAV